MSTESTVIIDWLGRGGIAQTTESWAIELRGLGRDVAVVTRPDRGLGSGAVPVLSPLAANGRLRAHHAVATTAAREIRKRTPASVVVQNYVVPALERPVFAAARSVGARVIIVVHDHRLHTWQAGTRVGLARQLQRADVVVAHTDFVADGVREFCGRRDVEVVPHPAQVGMLRHPVEIPALPPTDALWCGHFGVLRRRYKGGDSVERLARDAESGWRFLALGVGAPTDAPGLFAIPGYASPGAVVGTVSATAATVAPYRHATQSGVVVLAHLLGSVPVASAVGGIPEQIDDGVDGLLVAPGASDDEWRAALARLRDDEFRKDLAVAGTARAWRDHDEFARRIAELVA